jgi:hypothetical protein
MAEHICRLNVVMCISAEFCCKTKLQFHVCALCNDERQVPIDSTQNDAVYGLLVSFHCLPSSHFLAVE